MMSRLSVRGVVCCVSTVPVVVVVMVMLLAAGWSGGGVDAAVPRNHTGGGPALRVGAFNIKNFGKTKMSRPVVRGQIKEIVERYDVLLIQEIRDQSGDSVRQLLSMLELPFDFVISEPIGRTRYKEQYAYFYRTDTVLLLGTYQYEDPEDVFEREPYVVKIAPTLANHEMISLIGFHSKPSDATAEIGHLEDVIARTLDELGHNSEPVVLGDLNADCSYADLEARREASDYLTLTTTTYLWLTGEEADTTVRESTVCAYDRIIVRTSLADRVVVNSNAVFDFGQWLGLTEEEALAVSDHYPVEVVLQF